MRLQGKASRRFRSKEKCRKVLRVFVMEIAAAVLAGGKGSRFGGIPKGLLGLPSGETIIGRLLRVIKESGIPDTVIVTNDPVSYGREGASLIADITPGCGPISGIESALSHYFGSANAVLFLPCDLPYLSSHNVSRLKQEYYRAQAPVVFALTPGLVRHPLCSVVQVSVLGSVKKALTEGRYSICELWEQLSAAVVLFADSSRFTDVDTPLDYEMIAGGELCLQEENR